MLTMEAAPPVAPLGEAKAYLRIETDAEDAVLAGLMRAATGLVEAWLGRLLVARAVEERFASAGAEARLSAGPVIALLELFATDATGGEVAVEPGDWRLDLGPAGDGTVTLLRGPGRLRRARYRAGMAEDWNGLPDPLRLAVLRTVGHLHAHRDGSAEAGLPASVCQMLAPWRRLRLS